MNDQNHTLDRLYIPFHDFTSIGGPSTFLMNLQRFLEKHYYKVQSNPEGCAAIFFPIEHDLASLDAIKKNRGCVIQRLDGVYYPSKHGDEYILRNAVLRKIYLEYSDHVVFQSDYSRRQCFSILGEKRESEYSIILNGVHTDIFHPVERQFNRSNVQFITTGSFRNLDMLEPLVIALDKLRQGFQFKLHIVGPITNPDFQPFLEREYVVYHGEKNSVEVAQLLRSADIFLYSHLNPPCPNSVLEAVASGLPVVGFDSGSMSELCWFSKDLLAPVSDEIFQCYEDFSPSGLADKICLCIEGYDQYRQNALAHTRDYSFDECGKRYIEVFEQVLGRKTIRKTRKAGAIMDITNISGRVVRAVKKRVITSLPRFLGWTSDETFKQLVLKELDRRMVLLTPSESLKLIFDLDNRLYLLEGQASIRYGGGLHTKHRHIKYHDFFIQNTPNGSHVLDVGCGNGALTSDIAGHVGDVVVYGIDLVQANVDQAKAKYSGGNITYVCGDALTDLPDTPFDVIVLSNVLEHIEKRVEFLTMLNQKYHPSLFLVRVPCFDRDWRVPLKKELGMDYRLDETHAIEYLYDQFAGEIQDANLCIGSAKINWGEIWAVVKPRVA